MLFGMRCGMKNSDMCSKLIESAAMRNSYTASNRLNVAVSSQNETLWLWDHIEPRIDEEIEHVIRSQLLWDYRNE